MFGPGELLRSVTGQSEADKPLIIELAVTAMEEMVRMAQLNEPLWVHGLNGSTEMLNEDEYLRLFPRGIGPKPLGMRSEASRETAVVIMNHANLVEILMDVVHQYVSKRILKMVLHGTYRVYNKTSWIYNMMDADIVPLVLPPSPIFPLSSHVCPA
jgi:START domain